MILLALGVIIILASLYHFVYEGFQSSTEARYERRLANWESSINGGSGRLTQSDIAKKCQRNDSCSSCLADQDCGWAADYASPVSGMPTIKDGTILACIPQAGGYPFITSPLSDWINMSSGAKNLTNFITSLSKCTDVTCSSNMTCAKCAYYQKCTWQQKSASDGTVKQTCMDTSSAGSGSGSGSGASTTVNNITTVSMCPPPQCADLTDCVECTNATGCSFCTTSGKCLKNSEFGAGVNQCPISSKIDVPSKCPCGGITDCGICAGRTGCGYCKDTKKCVNLDILGMPPKGSCTPDTIITGAGECSGSGKRLPPPVDTRKAKDPSATSLNAAGNSGDLTRRHKHYDDDEHHRHGPHRGDGNNVVRPEEEYNTKKGKMFKKITAPGVARGIDDSNIPFSVKKDSLDTPLETYVKELVNSQLAAQGVPTNEPFQVNESAAIPNASDYMKKVFRGVFS